MLNVLLNIGISIVLTLGTVFGVYKYLPLSALEPKPVLGVSITNIAGTDTLSSSRSVINTNFSNLDNGKIENSTTTLPLLTGIGTIVTGTWNATAISVAKGVSLVISPSAKILVWPGFIISVLNTGTIVFSGVISTSPLINASLSCSPV